MDIEKLFKTADFARNPAHKEKLRAALFGQGRGTADVGGGRGAANVGEARGTTLFGAARGAANFGESKTVNAGKGRGTANVARLARLLSEAELEQVSAAGAATPLEASGKPDSKKIF